MNTQENEWTILKLKGTDKLLFSLVGPMVMTPAVLAANDNYPFRTTEKHVWYVAVRGKKNVLGFLSVVNNTIGNDYVNKNLKLLEALLNQAITDQPKGSTLYFMAGKNELPLLEEMGFLIDKETVNYTRVFIDIL
ncbi:MAG: hypothetical protein LBS25_06670 [Candidatus Symbiothrix sp.]|jgi:hypothetical protein|nr:hypothetical protein [Candidatus Symbiothrix sp.]